MGNVKLGFSLRHVDSLLEAGLLRTSMSSPFWIWSFLFSSWDSCFVSHKITHLPRRPWTKSRTSPTTLGTRTRSSKIQGGEDVDVLRIPGSRCESSDVKECTQRWKRWVVFMSYQNNFYDYFSINQHFGNISSVWYIKTVFSKCEFILCWFIKLQL